ncbi:MAG: transcription antitermination factor NusB [Clostridia bacterium]|nr:transcription antitermination factor NusB [Clostridia bacterium]
MRKLAREIAFEVIFGSEFNKEFDVELSFVSALNEMDLKNEDKQFAKELIDIYFANRDEIALIISQKIKRYEIDRVYKVDLALLKLAIAEILFYKKTPNAVVVNEILELAKKYSTENSVKFLNGVLAGAIEDANAR